MKFKVFSHYWNKHTKDIEDLNLLIKNNKIIEDYNFEEIIKKYNIRDYIITLVYKNRNEVKTLSKLKLSNLLKINTKKYEYIDLENEKDFNKILDSLKTSYEDYWKDLNQINTSIKLILRISVDAKKYLKIKKFENSLNRMDLVSNLTITKFDHQNIYFKVIYNLYESDCYYIAINSTIWIYIVLDWVWVFLSFTRKSFLTLSYMLPMIKNIIFPEMREKNSFHFLFSKHFL